MEIKPKGPSIKGPEQFFRGDVWLDQLVAPDATSGLSVAHVHFAPGARTAWHAHSLGQVLFVTDGQGLVQSRGESIATVRPGDVAHTPADEWHWHGATHDHFMAHLSMTPGDVEWGDHVTDAEYRGGA